MTVHTPHAVCVIIPCVVHTCREEREAWIKAKYERNEFLSDLPESTLTFSEVCVCVHVCECV